MAADKNTPLMQQYYEIKSQYPDSILFYRVGDFYETFADDAVVVSKVLGLVLTRKASGAGSYTNLAGVPHHAIDIYLPKMVAAGYKVAICDQLEDPKLTKKLVKRGVTELVTPGVNYNEALLAAERNNWLCALYFEKDLAGAAFLDISTGTFRVAQGSLDFMDMLLADFSPKEILLQRGFEDGFRARFADKAFITPLEGWAFVYHTAYKKLINQFDTDSLKGFGVEDMPLAITAAGAVMAYLDLTEHKDISHIRTLGRIDRSDFMWIDRFTSRALELLSPMSASGGAALIDILDECRSPMGSRCLRQWLAMPLKSPEAIKVRADAVQALFEREPACDAIREDIAQVGDLERIVSRAAAGKILPREVLQLGRGLEKIASIIEQGRDIAAIGRYIGRLDALQGLAAGIAATIKADTAQQIGKGEVICSGIDASLDEYRNILTNSKQILLDIQQRERDATGISSLKVSYNNVFGYYLEVRNTYKELVPPEWIRKQTLVGAERYITAELKQYEEKILVAQDQIVAIETRIYAELVGQLQKNIAVIQQNAAAVSELDCLAAFAFTAHKNNYCRPVVDDSLEIDIKQGRHPVIEALMGEGEQYIANDVYLANDSQQIIILTGPNMAGKSALLRQTALIVLMAQIGSFVPAASARIGYVDKLFTRVGASDNISRGESTFMVEMTESATILTNLSQRSLLLLDEIGRGTSTSDGMSIAWAIVEYLHGTP
ncbi:MAG: DNA mismatch repair protein MutS, partial [Bacteroidales bacterium]|nr:DNA mismatch repair protein MutS [Bacteroidales bacterium]